jgi:hypothetical protein
MRLGYLLACAVVACASGQAQPESADTKTDGAAADAGEHEPGPVGTQLVRDVTESKETFEIGVDKQAGLGGYNVVHEGKALWPPQGEGCEKLVGCCTELAGRVNAHAMSCLLALARDKTCGAALSTAVAIVQEQAYSLPDSCK